MKPRQERIALIVCEMAAVSIATILVMKALNSNIATPVTPTEVAEGKASQNKTFRMGGIVKEESVRRDNLKKAIDWFGEGCFWAAFIAGLAPISDKIFPVPAGALRSLCCHLRLRRWSVAVPGSISSSAS